MTKATMEARLTWLVKLVRPVTTISWGGAWIMETKVLLLLGGVACVKPWPRSPCLGWRGFAARDLSRPPGGSRKFTYLVQKPVSTIGFNKRFQDLIQVPDSQNRFKKAISESGFQQTGFQV